jgi:hypothetical protein
MTYNKGTLILSFCPPGSKAEQPVPDHYFYLADKEKIESCRELQMGYNQAFSNHTQSGAVG